VREIAADIAGGRPMTRLLQGDVGSGKTAVAVYACLVAIANRRQAAIMTPTEILTTQHYQKIEQYLAGSRVRRVLLRGRQPKSDRAAALRQIERGEVDLVIGTQAIIQGDVKFKDLALVVVDEQHRFGVMQRHVFRTKGVTPHYLVMSATPIPRSLAMTVFGDLDVSTIRTAPAGRGEVTTKVTPYKQWAVVMDYVRTRIERGEQAYVVAPLVGAEPERNSQPTSDPAKSTREEAGRQLTTAVDLHKRLLAGPWRDLRVGLLHGAMRPAEKERTMADFAAGRLQALVATTVVEVGVDVPNATMMVIEHADRFGLAQLHQLRGRVGRGSRDGLCVLLTESLGGTAGARLSVLSQTHDGFRIAEEDLRLRGPGQFFGTRQHGLPELKYANIVGDTELVSLAQQEARRIVDLDPHLGLPEHKLLREELTRFMGDTFALIDAA
jgi:ATP-dependent DNA helicase RecG